MHHFLVITEALITIVILSAVTKSSRWSSGNGISKMDAIKVMIDLFVCSIGEGVNSFTGNSCDLPGSFTNESAILQSS